MTNKAPYLKHLLEICSRAREQYETIEKKIKRDGEKALTKLRRMNVI